MKYSKGIMWLDDCRIPFVETEDIDFNSLEKNNKTGSVYGNGKGFHIKHERLQYTNKGRFTPNLLCMDDVLNDGSVAKSSLFMKTNTPIFNTKEGWNNNNISGSTGGGFNDKGTNSRYYDLDLWFDKMLERL